MKERIVYIDAMRGLAMVMVVMFHCSVFSFGNMTPFCWIVNYNFQIPLFFMISGFFMQSALRQQPLSLIRHKAIRLVVPAFIMLALYCWTFHKDFVFSVFERMKMGYWFTLLLFGYIVLFVAISYALRELKVSKVNSYRIHITFAIIVSYSALALNSYGESRPWVSLLSLAEYFNYFFFVIGALLFPIRKRALNTLNNKYLMGGGILVLFVGIIFESLYDTNWMRYGAGLYHIVVRSLGLMIIWFLFHKYNSLSSASYLGRSLSFIGKRSIDVYFLHYFFLPYGLHSWGDYLISINAPLILDLCSMALALVIIIMSIGVGYILRQSSFTAKLLLGA